MLIYFVYFTHYTFYISGNCSNLFSSLATGLKKTNNCDLTFIYFVLYVFISLVLNHYFIFINNQLQRNRSIKAIGILFLVLLRFIML